MAVRSIKVWNASASAWEGVAVEAPDFGSFVSASVVDAKGDLLAGSADNTVTRLAAGSNGQMLMADSGATAGLRYVDPPTNRNFIINGAMQIAERGSSSTGITATAYNTADRWRLGISSLGTWTQSVEADGPSGSGLRNSLKMLCTTADAAPAASDVLDIGQRIEGQNLQGVKKGFSSAEQLTVSFWVKSNVTGTYIVHLRDTDNSRHVSASYSVVASATWERKTVTFPADTTGTLDNDSNASLALIFALAAGSNFTSGTLQTTWASSTGADANRYVGQTNLAAATNNYWQVTGVQLEAGPVATPFEFEPYEATFNKCLRYYYVIPGTTVICNGNRYTATSCYGIVRHPVVMRDSPTLSQTTGTDYYRFLANGVADLFDSFDGITDSNKYVARLDVTSGVSGTAGDGGWFRTDVGSLAFSAEL